MKAIDISMTISQDTPTYPGDPKVAIKSSVKGNCLVSRVSMSLHTGTHIDAPAHYIRGAKTLAEIPLERLMTKAKVLDLTSAGDRIGVSDLRQFQIRKGDTLLLKTKNSRLLKEPGFSKEYATLTPEAAYLLADRKVNAVGVDYMSVDRQGEDIVHRILLQRGVAVIEGLDLTLAKNGVYKMLCLPMKFTGVEAAPARCVLIK
jgi:arylformamidase